MKVSVVLTVYNINTQFLNACLGSLSKQTLQDFEIVIIDDCSQQDYSYLKAKPKVRLLRNEVNLGMCKSVNAAFKVCKGDYIVRLGSDDLFNKNLLQRESEFLDRNPAYGAVCCEMEKFGRRSVYIRRTPFNLQKILDGDYKSHGYAGGMMFRRSLLKYISIDESLPVCEDFDFHLQILECAPIGTLNYVMYYYRQHESNITLKYNKAQKLEIIKGIVKKHRSAEWQRKTAFRRIQLT